MATLPQLIEEDMRRLNEALQEFVGQTDATAALIIDKGGFLITHQGDCSQLDVTTIGALASGAFMANQTIAGLVNEPNFNSVYQQGEKSSMLVVNIDDHCLLIVIFNAALGVGTMKYHAAGAIRRVASQMAAAQKRNPDGGYDLSVLNIADTESLFRKKKSEARRIPPSAPVPPEVKYRKLIPHSHRHARPLTPVPKELNQATLHASFA